MSSPQPGARAPAQPQSLRDLLRRSTADLHAALDLGLSPLFDEGERGYRSFLASSARALLPLEAALEAGGIDRVLPDWPARSRRACLLEDLAALGIPTEDGPAGPGRIEGEAALLGTAYVLEGSRLGARQLVRLVLAHRRPGGAGTRYLSHGADRPLWRSFLEILERSLPARREPQRTVAAARAAFGLFQAAFVVGR
ncbi:biliverdin-producing heme oxygenase [Reyranella sp.]|uniref:biliverdin-producing heme oxygenase n=1 Tax=Reyranella sp. TaxID=1929291 RepID=UPI003BA9BCBF